MTRSVSPEGMSPEDEKASAPSKS